MNLDPIVSIIIPVFNCEDFISTTIESIMNQTFDSWEIVIIDDGSTDSTRIKVLPYTNTEKIRYYHQANSGVGSARNFGLTKIQNSKYICFIDGDDFIHKEFLKKLVSFLEYNANTPAVYCDFEYVDIQNNILENTYKLKNRKLSPFWIKDAKTRYISIETLMLGSSISEAFTLFRASCFDNFKWDEELKYAEGLNLFLNIVQKYGKIYSYDYKLYFYRVRENQSQQILTEMEKRIFLRKSISKFIFQSNSELILRLSHLQRCIDLRLGIQAIIGSFLFDFRNNKLKALIQISKVPLSYVLSIYFFIKSRL